MKSMVEETSRVTVVIPCYNRERFIRETLESALSQTYPNLEIVAIDDGSTDGTRKILEDYGGRIRILEHPGRTNKGQSAAINLGIRSTKGNYIAILDSDDLWAPEKIERQVEFLEKNPDVGLVYVNGFAVDEEGKTLYMLFRPGHVEPNSPGRVLLECHFSVPSNALVRRSDFEMAGEFDETMRSAQDHDMAIRLAEVTKLAYLDELLWYYRRHLYTQSQKHSRRRWQTGFKILSKACERRPYGLNIRRRRLAVLNFRLGQCLIEEKRFGQAAARFTIAGLLDPLRAIKVLAGLERRGSPH